MMSYGVSEASRVSRSRVALRGMLVWTLALGCACSAWALALPPDSPFRDAGSLRPTEVPAACSTEQANVPAAARVLPDSGEPARASAANDLGAVRSDTPAADAPRGRDACQHRVDLYDYYGDGWTGNKLDVLVNEVVVLNHITLASGAGPQSFYFMAATGDTIRTIYYATGSYPYENYYKLYDGVGGLLAQDGIPNVQRPSGVTVTGNCEPPPTGACCHANGDCEMVQSAAECIDGTFLGLGHTCLECVCTVECPAGAIPEAEPCGEALDDGCNSYGTPEFMTIECGQTICGTTWANTSTRDTDWYRFTVSESNTLSLTVEAEFRVRAIVLQPFPYECDDPWILADGTADACAPLTIQSNCRPMDEYWVWIGPADFEAQACADYKFTLTCTPCYIAEGACCFTDGGCEFWTYQKCYVAGGHWLGENVPCTDCVPYYCDSISQMCNPGDEYIARVQIGTLDNSSECTYYGDYTGLSTDVLIGGETLLTVTNGAPVWGMDACAAWVDYNHDLVFSTDEQVGLDGGVGPYKFLVAPPLTATPGPTRMRIVLSWTTPEVCGKYPVGETEDYTVVLREAPGACCHLDDTCTNEVQSSCDGFWGGPFTTCAFDDCNANGLDDFCDVLYGTSDDCNANYLPDECESGTSVDCNLNDAPDFCDIALGRSQDLNGNGIPDECDIGDCPEGETWCADCNRNGIPDGVETAGHDSESFQLDDGTHEDNIGLGHYGGYLVWLSGFVVSGTDVRLTRLEIAFGTVANGTPVTLYVWTDPNGDGDPHDAQLLTSVDMVVAHSDQDIFNVVNIPPLDVGPAGSRFFVGATVHHAAGIYPASLDKTSSAGQSWLCGDQVPVDPNHLDEAVFGLYTIDWYGFPGNWLIRADAAGDCNQNGVPDACDVPPLCEGAGCSMDCDSNLVPDECEPDCNGNGRTDACDISSGSSLDCNANGVPDECDLAAGTSPDCNANAVPDECDLANCLGDPACADCNDNGIPDGCDIAAGTSPDCQTDGVPDECQLWSNDRDILVWDDGSSENGIGLTAGGALAWVNHFTSTEPGTIQAIQACFGSSSYPGSSGAAAGDAFGVYVWSDPNGDGNPVDGVLLAQAVGTVEAGSIDTDVFQSVAISALVSGSFFVGVSFEHTAGTYPGPIDQTAPQHNSWLSFNSVPYDPTVWDPASTYNMDDILVGNWLLRAEITFGAPANDCNENGIPDECDIGAQWGGYCTGANCSPDRDYDGIPDDCEVCPGDLNCDGQVSFGDINPFVLRLSSPAAYAAAYPTCADGNGDINGNGTVAFDDINPFVALLSGGSLPLMCP